MARLLVQNPPVYWDLHPQPSPGFTGNRSQKEEISSVWGSSEGRSGSKLLSIKWPVSVFIDHPAVHDTFVHESSWLDRKKLIFAAFATS